MTSTFRSGDVLRHTNLHGVTNYIRIGGPNPDGTPSIYVMACKPNGELIPGTGRYLRADTIASRYQAATTQPTERYR
jgi:hypothetical protein